MHCSEKALSVVGRTISERTLSELMSNGNALMELNDE
jgi:hypothetical protein